MASSPTLTLAPGIHLVSTAAAAATTTAAAVDASSDSGVSFLIDGIVNLHAACILHDHTLATFLPPLSHSQLYQWWEKRLGEVTACERHIIVYVSNVADRTANHDLKAPWAAEGRDWPAVLRVPTDGDGDGDAQAAALEISGVVSLGTPFSQTGPFRAEVQKLFVHPMHRRRGIARKMMARLETVALDHGRWNLMLDTEVGSAAEEVYPKLGYERLGVVREYGYSLRDGRLVDEMWYWKDLRKMARLKEEEGKEKESI
ncbi:acetyltransferase [Cladophialophora carrionii]|uniref:Acetyltransferase n=1 Tax=Cladophialophora carrionii TaxID=86049 RepID=A0A1C1CA21_9EURO|nr:acetyltransferase [Cladophialophora carrionii]